MYSPLSYPQQQYEPAPDYKFDQEYHKPASQRNLERMRAEEEKARKAVENSWHRRIPRQINNAKNLMWEDFKTTMYDNWSPVSDAGKWLMHRANPFVWGDQNTTWNAIRGRSRQRLKEMEQADDALAEKYGITGWGRVATKLGGSLAGNLLDPSSVALTVATGGAAAPLHAVKAAKGAYAAGKAATVSAKAVKAMKAAAAARKAYKRAHDIQYAWKTYGKGARTAKNMYKAYKAQKNMSWAQKLPRWALRRLPAEAATEFAEYGLSPGVAADRERTLYRDKSGAYRVKDPELLRSLYYQLRGMGNPYEQVLDRQTAGELEALAQEYGTTPEKLYYELSGMDDSQMA